MENEFPPTDRTLRAMDNAVCGWSMDQYVALTDEALNDLVDRVSEVATTLLREERAKARVELFVAILKQGFNEETQDWIRSRAIFEADQLNA